jgi:hypothetical protein
MSNDPVAAEIQLNDMLRIANNNYNFEAVDQNGHDILTRKTNVANAAIRVVTKVMEIVGGEGFFVVSVWSGSSATFRPRYHPLPESDQATFSASIYDRTKACRAGRQVGPTLSLGKRPAAPILKRLERLEPLEPVDLQLSA